METTNDSQRPPYQLPIWASLLIAVLAVAALGGSVYWYMRGATAQSVALSVPKLSPREVAMNRLRDLVISGDLAAVKATIEADPGLATAQNSSAHKQTPLHTAAWHGQIPIATFLMDKGADPNIVEEEFHGTPLSWAVVSGQRPMVELLIARGGRPSPDFVKMAEAGARGEFKQFSSSPVTNYPPIAELLKSKL